MLRTFVKENDKTIEKGIAGLVVCHIDGKEWKKDVLMLTVYVKDVDGLTAGPYEIPQEYTELREGNKP